MHRPTRIARCLIPMAFCLAVAAPVAARAEVRLPGIFSEGMVLQRGTPVRIWGWADDGERVVVSFCGQEVAATPRDGRWEARLEPLDAGGPFPLTIAGAKNTITLKDVLVGEVWVSCGQSNMMMGLGKASTGGEAIAASSQFPQIRFANVPDGRADKPADDVSLTWKTAGPATLSGFSAVSYFFGREIHRRLGVPVGERLALLARAVAYGEPLVHSGPIFRSLAVEGPAVVVSFDHVGGGLEARDGELKGFEVAGPDHRYHWARAEIRGGTVVLSHPDVSEPAFVRYAWANYYREHPIVDSRAAVQSLFSSKPEAQARENAGPKSDSLACASGLHGTWRSPKSTTICSR